MTPSVPTDLNTCSLGELYDELCAERAPVLLALARDEDFAGRTDATTVACGLAGAIETHAVVRHPCVLAGLTSKLLDATRIAFEHHGLVIEPLRPDAERADAGDVIVRVAGDVRDVLAVERTVLNLLGRLCGVATLTAEYIAAAREGSPTVHICETRKTTPGWRGLEKYAVRCGGGTLHRVGLFDAVLIKDNHLSGVPDAELAEFVRTAGARARAGGPLRFVEVEVDTLDQLDVLLTLEPGVVDIILLDNMPPDALRDAVARRDASPAAPQLEASGGITLDTIGAIAATGVDRISVGALTHQARSIDIGLDAAPR
ncbi:MAG: carboxylating nicotinate-nucleotide diphosphorylase [Planctomycetota bacterium]